MRAGTRALRCRCMCATTECADQRGDCRRLAAAVRRQDARPVERLQRRRADHAVACRRRLHPGQRRRQRPVGLHRHEETVRKLHPRLGLETLLRRQQRNALPRGRRPLLQGALRHGARIPADRQRGLGRSQCPQQTRRVAETGRGLRHAPARSRFAVRQPAGRVELVAHRLRQRPCRALAQRPQDPRIRCLHGRLVRPQAQRQMGDRTRIRTGAPRCDLPAGSRFARFVPQPEDQGAAAARPAARSSCSTAKT